MGLPWVRMDTGWTSNPKFLMLVEDKKWHAIAVYWAALGWSGLHGQNGFVPYYALGQCHATRKEASDLVGVRLWQVDDGGWQINDYTEYQPSNEENELRRKRAREAALTRWHGKAG